MNPISLTINGQQVTAAPGFSILEAATAIGIEIPTLCFHDALHETGSCWMCIVEIKGKNRFVPACHTLVSEGMVIETDNETLNSMRRQSLERIIEDHSGDCMGPCELSCPAGCDIPDFVAAISNQNDRDAIKIIKDTIPLPGILGRICPAPCEDECRRHGIDTPVSICALKRYAADRDSLQPDRFIPEVSKKSGKKVAIIGSGPAGLSAAYFLLSQGHAVTLFESSAKAGGMMRYGIPRFRLPDTVIESDIAPLMNMGAQFRFNTTFGKEITLDALKKEYDALFLAVGAQSASTMNIPGENEPGVISGIEFLRKAASGEELHPGERVIVTGGGDTAIDAARTAIRLGASTVTILYRRSKLEMPANPVEIEEALAEGIALIERASPTAIRTINGALEISAVKMQPGDPDNTRRRKPVPVDGSEFTITADTIISAIGQYIDPAAGTTSEIGSKESGELQVHPETLQSATPWIFAGGDCVTGTTIAIRAVEQGKRAAHSINLFLNGESFTAQKTAFNSSYGARDEAPHTFYQGKSPAKRIPMPELPVEKRSKSFTEVALGYTADLAIHEAQRCLQCRCNAITDCRLRELANRYFPLHTAEKHDHPGFYKAGTADITMEREKCVDCGICIRMLEQLENGSALDCVVMTESCPTGAISSTRK
ncbi:MAG: FAD-dependent oxidoreductase [Chlorobiales bacterium]|nr:FAD-dependent oxidoreductase [Chlorobiales bacterium]